MSLVTFKTGQPGPVRLAVILEEVIFFFMAPLAFLQGIYNLSGRRSHRPLFNGCRSQDDQNRQQEERNSQHKYCPLRAASSEKEWVLICGTMRNYQISWHAIETAHAFCGA